MRLGDMKPLHDALLEIAGLEQVARDSFGDDAARPIGKARTILERAIEQAENTDLELNVQQYADLHDISKWAVYRGIKAGTIPAERKPGRGLVISVQAA